MPKKGARLRWAAKAQTNRDQYNGRQPHINQRIATYSMDITRSQKRIVWLEAVIEADPAHDYNYLPQLVAEQESLACLKRGLRYITTSDEQVEG